ncbi:MAG TPA: hypothetical protein VGS11_05065 [Candidatus Bathyarchaeia archaeon]|nr:hypothetical protein [Candidatus Bathyarchaeia archaeon]
MRRRIITFVVLFACFSLIYSSVAYYALSKPPAQPFIGWGVFSPSDTLSNYFSGVGINVTAHKVLNWHFEVTNHMGSIQYIGIVYRLGNSTNRNPNATTPSTAPQIGNNSRFIPNGQTASINFTWSINSENQAGGLVILNMTINGQQVSPPIGAVKGLKFRFFFELWTYDLTANSLFYGYEVSGSRIGDWLQVWFNAA